MIDQHMDVQMAFGPLAILAAGAGLKALGGLFGKKSKDKKEDASAKAQFEQGSKQHANNEAQRTGGLKSIIAAMASRGINLPIDPSMLETRQYAGPDQRQVAQAGRGSGLLGSILGGAGDLATSYGAGQQQDQILSAGMPVGEGGGGLDVEQLSQMAAEAGATPEEVSALVEEMMKDRGGAVKLGGR
jgi:hypothetical protein